MWWSAQDFSPINPTLPKVSLRFPPIIPTPIDNVWRKRLTLKLVAPKLSPSSPHFSSPHDHTHSHFLSVEFSVSLSKTLHGFTVSVSHSKPPPLLQWQLSHSASNGSSLHARPHHEPVPFNPIVADLELRHEDRQWEKQYIENAHPGLIHGSARTRTRLRDSGT